MSLFGKIFKGLKKVVTAPVKMVKNAFHGDPLSIVALAASLYGGYSALANSGLTGAGLQAAENTAESAGITGAGLSGASSVSSDLANIGSEIASGTGAGTASGLSGAVTAATETAGNFYPTMSELGTQNMSVGNATNIASNVGSSTGKGLLSKFWDSLDSKGKVGVLGLGVKTIGGFLEGYNQSQIAKEQMKLLRDQMPTPNASKTYRQYWNERGGQPSNRVDYEGVKRYKEQAQIWAESDNILAKRLAVIQNRMQDPEYRRGFYTLAGLLANPKKNELIKTDPMSIIY